LRAATRLAAHCKTLLLQLALVRLEAALEQSHQVAARQPMPGEAPHPLEQRAKLSIRSEMHAESIR
jgi:hypothetical protein